MITHILWLIGMLHSVNWFIHTSWILVVIQTDHPKLVRNRCVIEFVDDVLSCIFNFNFLMV